MADNDKITQWQDEAKKAGYAIVPQGDFTSLQESSDSLKKFRSSIPQEYIGKEEEFFSKANEALKPVEKETNVEDKDKNTDAPDLSGFVTVDDFKALQERLDKQENTITGLRSENNTLKSERDDSAKGDDLRTLMQQRNIRVIDEFITDDLFNTVDRSKVDFTNPQTVEQYYDELFKKVLVPAMEKQERVAKRLGVSNPNQPTPTLNDEDDDEKKAAMNMGSWGGLGLR